MYTLLFSCLSSFLAFYFFGSSRLTVNVVVIGSILMGTLPIVIIVIIIIVRVISAVIRCTKRDKKIEGVTLHNI